MIGEYYESPCHFCNDRKLRCHSSCDKYCKYKQRLDDIRTMVNRDKDTDQAIERALYKTTFSRWCKKYRKRDKDEGNY